MKKSTYITWLIFVIFFVISLLTNILGPIIPALIEGFQINVALAGLLTFSFFIAYGIMSIPAGLMLERYKEKKMLLLAFTVSCLGALSFALWPTYMTGMASLFVIGCGMAMLQVVINPLLRTAGGEANFAFNSVLAQLFFGAASYVGPHIYSYLVQHLFADGIHKPAWIELLEQVVPRDKNWLSLYWIFAIISLLMLLLIWSIHLPKVELKEEEKIEIGKPMKTLLQNKTVWLFFLGIFAYVGTEQGIANDKSKLLSDRWNHSDDEMYFLGYWGLYRYALNDTLKNNYRETILDHWEYEKPEKDALWNFFAAMVGKEDVDLEGAKWFLEEHPLDLINWTIKNSHRKDLNHLPENFMYQSTDKVLSPKERPVHRHNRTTFILDEANGGNTEFSAGDIWLLPYWMGRYLKLLQ